MCENWAQLQCCGLSLEYCVRVWCKNTEMAEKYANQQYAVSSHSEDMAQDVCVH